MQNSSWSELKENLSPAGLCLSGPFTWHSRWWKEELFAQGSHHPAALGFSSALEPDQSFTQCTAIT